MFRYILKRLLFVVPVLFCVTILIFTILYFTPVDVADVILGGEATEAEVEALRAELGLNDGYFVRLGKFLFNAVFKGDLGNSYHTKQPVINEISQRFPNTLILATASVALAALFGIPLGIISAVKQYSWQDRVLTTLSLAGVSVPGFWLGLMLSLLFALKLKWLPPSGFYGVEYWILPSITISLLPMGTITRMTRSSMLEVIRQDYITTARAKGQSEYKVIIVHALKNAMIPLVTVIGNSFGVAIGGTMVTETVFSVPGIGSYMMNAIKTRDYPEIQGCVLYTAVAVSLIMLIVDIAYAVIDPRIKLDTKKHKGKAVSE